MRRCVFFRPRRGLLIGPGILAVALTVGLSGPSFAVTSAQKMATCKFGADDQKLQGTARNAFMKKCMANKNDPRGTTPGTPAAAAPKQ